MDGHDDENPTEQVELTVPDTVAAEIDRLFVECRGYEPTSAQESLTLLCDLAADRLEPPRNPGAADSVRSTSTDTGRVSDAAAIGDPVSVSRASPVDGSTASGGDDGVGEWTAAPEDDRDRRIDDAFPTRWGADPVVRRRLRAVVDRYVRDPTTFRGRDDREADALAAVARHEGLSPDELHDDLVTTLYGNAGLPDDFAAEFFTDALSRVLDSELETDFDTDTGFDAATDAEQAARAESETPAQSDTAAESQSRQADDFDVDSLLGDVSQPMADCEGCGETRPVNDLETVIGSKTATIELLCRDCTADAE